MTEHNGKAAAIRARIASTRSALEDRRRELEDLLDGLPFGDPRRPFFSRQLSETEDLIQELDRTTDGVGYGER